MTEPSRLLVQVDDNGLGAAVDSLTSALRAPNLPARSEGLVHLSLPCVSLIERGVSDPRSFDVVASTSTIDSYGEIVAQDWNLKRFLANPVVLFGHDAWGLPIGKAADVRVEGSQLKMRITLASEKANPRAEQVYQAMKEGILRGISVGFKPGKRALLTQEDGTEVVTLLGNDLFEVSVVTLPANPDAVALSAKAVRAAIAAIPSTDAPAPNGEPVQGKALTTMLPMLITLAAIVGLGADAKDSEVEASVRSLKRGADDLRALTGKSSLDEAVAAAKGWKDSAAELEKATARVKALEDEGEKRDHAEAVRELKAAKKLPPAQMKWAATQTAAQLRAWGENAPVIEALAAKALEEPVTGASGELTHEGKTWAQMRPMEKAALYKSDRGLYEQMKVGAAI